VLPQNEGKRLSGMSVCMEQLGFRWTDFNGILYLRIFQKSVKKIQVELKSDKNNGCFMWRPMYIYVETHVHLCGDPFTFMKYIAEFF